MLSDEIWIRSCDILDLGRLAELEARCFTLAWSKNSLRLDLLFNPAARYWAATTDKGELVGYISCWLTGQEAEIIKLAVAPAWRRLGIGSKLISHMLDYLAATTIEEIFLDVRENNLAAQALYKRMGFAAVGRRPAYYQDNGEAAVIMSLKMPPKKKFR